MNKKIKIIDLLVKIAKGEEVPKKIKREYGIVYTLNFGHETPTYYDDNDRTLWNGYNFNILNEEVEILEDNTEEIGEIGEFVDLIGMNENEEVLFKMIRCCTHKIDELVKAVNQIKKESE